MLLHSRVIPAVVTAVPPTAAAVARTVMMAALMAVN